MTHFQFRDVAPPLLKNTKADVGFFLGTLSRLGMEKKSLKIGAEMAVLALVWRPSWIHSGIDRSGTVSRNLTELFSSIFSSPGLPFEVWVLALEWRPSWIRSGIDRSGTVSRNSTELFFPSSSLPRGYPLRSLYIATKIWYTAIYGRICTVNGPILSHKGTYMKDKYLFLTYMFK